MPPSASSKRPSLRPMAPVKAPFSWPNSWHSRSASDSAAQFTRANGRSRRGEPRAAPARRAPCRARLPCTRMVALVGATRFTTSIAENARARRRRSGRGAGSAQRLPWPCGAAACRAPSRGGGAPGPGRAAGRRSCRHRRRVATAASSRSRSVDTTTAASRRSARRRPTIAAGSSPGRRGVGEHRRGLESSARARGRPPPRTPRRRRAALAQRRADEPPSSGFGSTMRTRSRFISARRDNRKSHTRLWRIPGCTVAAAATARRRSPRLPAPKPVRGHGFFAGPAPRARGACRRRPCARAPARRPMRPADEDPLAWKPCARQDEALRPPGWNGPQARRPRRSGRGDIRSSRVDAIVNAANASLLGGGGVDGAAPPARRSSPSAGRSARRKAGEDHGGHRLLAKHVIHAVGPIWRGGQRGEDAALASCYRTAMQLAAAHGLPHRLPRDLDGRLPLPARARDADRRGGGGAGPRGGRPSSAPSSAASRRRTARRTKRVLDEREG